MTVLAMLLMTVSVVVLWACMKASAMAERAAERLEAEMRREEREEEYW